jgi:uncharacterized membrane-anchored protein
VGLFFGLFLIFLVAQLVSKAYHPLIFWTVILLTATTGTAVSDFIDDRTLGLGYVVGTLILIALLLGVLGLWYLSERSLAVDQIRTHKAEVFYWVAILVSNTLGTALGDFLADSSGLGFVGANMLITGALGLVLLATFFTRISRVPLF